MAYKQMNSRGGGAPQMTSLVSHNNQGSGISARSKRNARADATQDSMINPAHTLQRPIARKVSNKRLTKKELKEIEKIDKLAMPRVTPNNLPAGINNDESADSAGTKASKKRGRKLTEPNKYFFESEQKIKEWKEILKSNRNKDGRPLTNEDKQKLRNQISAQRSRSNKKIEVAGLQEQINHFKAQWRFVLKTLNEELEEGQKEKVQNRIFD